MSEEENYEEGNELAALLSLLDEIKALAASTEKHAIVASKEQRATLLKATAASEGLSSLTDTVQNGLGSLSRQIQVLQVELPQKRTKRSTAAILALLIALGAFIGSGSVLLGTKTTAVCSLLGGNQSSYTDGTPLCVFERFH